MYFAKKISLCFFLLCFTLAGWAQPRMHLSQQQSNEHYNSFRSFVQAGQQYEIQLPAPVTSIAIDIPVPYGFDGMYVVAGTDTFNLTENIHLPEEVKEAFATSTSNLVIFKGAIQRFSLYSGKVAGEIIVHAVSAGTVEDAAKKKAQALSEENKAAEACQKPATIDQVVWREGLDAPKNTPRQNQAKHLIVHHSATSNSATDYYNVVRNIYLYHTNVNKWDDIGYNYLIAPDGTIFEGREDFDSFGEDNVMGAHFCAKNSGTMGICIIGDYSSTAMPTEAAMNSLRSILAWKAIKENLDVNASYLHPENNASAQPLGVIAGHRNGCATECPGANVYARLSEIKEQVNALMMACKAVAGASKATEQQISLVPNPAHEQVLLQVRGINKVNRIYLSDLAGQLIRQWPALIGSSLTLDLSGLGPGLYLISAETEKGRFISKLVVN